MSRGMWREIEERSVVIPESLTGSEAILLIEEHMDLTAEQRSALEAIDSGEKDSGIDFIEQALSGPLGSLKVTKLGIVESPVRACILICPQVVAVRS